MKVLTKISAIILATTALITSASCSLVKERISVTPTPTPEPTSFVDKYNFEDLLEQTVSYDLDGNGNKDTIKFDRYSMYSNQMGDDCSRYDCYINNKKYHLLDTRFEICERVYFTDLDPTDKYLDIVLLYHYKSLSAKIFRFDGVDLSELQQPTNDGETMQLYTVVSTVRDQNKLNTLIDDVEIKIPQSEEDENEFTFVCGDESFTYKKVSDGVYEEK